MTDDTQLKTAVAAEYVALADLLEGSAEEAWNTQSLCEIWRVREVVAHMTMPARYDKAAFMAELERRGFDFTRFCNEIAASDGALPTSQLVANLRDEALHGWEPPGGGAEGALTHAMIHSLDITLPLGQTRLSSDAAVASVLDALTTGGKHAFFGIGIDGRRLVATDLDWSFGADTGTRTGTSSGSGSGSGSELRGDAGALVAALAGRTPPGLVGDALVTGQPTPAA
jgi:uncharacterized protein (TIGR03083 family)